MKAFLANRCTRIGLALVLFGWGPLWGIVLLAAVGLWPDPNPNPVGPGLLFAITGWPAIICLGLGWWRSRRMQG
jgi:hypothetical protein